MIKALIKRIVIEENKLVITINNELSFDIPYVKVKKTKKNDTNHDDLHQPSVSKIEYLNMSTAGH